MAEANLQKANEYKIANTTRLLSDGADANAQDDQGFTPLHFAAASRTSVEVAQLLLDAGADINARNHNDGFTGLKYVERYGRPELRELFADLL